MCKMASFFHNPNTGDIKVWDLVGHNETAEHLGLDMKYWREGHYLPDGTVECRVIKIDKYSQKYCNERLKCRFPTFKRFLRWALKQSIDGSLYLRGCDVKGLKLPESIDGSLYLSGNENGYSELVKQYQALKTACDDNKI